MLQKIVSILIFLNTLMLPFASAGMPDSRMMNLEHHSVAKAMMDCSRGTDTDCLNCCNVSCSQCDHCACAVPHFSLLGKPVVGIIPLFAQVLKPGSHSRLVSQFLLPELPPPLV